VQKLGRNRTTKLQDNDFWLPLEMYGVEYWEKKIALYCCYNAPTLFWNLQRDLESVRSMAPLCSTVSLSVLYSVNPLHWEDIPHSPPIEVLDSSVGSPLWEPSIPSAQKISWYFGILNIFKYYVMRHQSQYQYDLYILLLKWWTDESFRVMALYQEHMC